MSSSDSEAFESADEDVIETKTAAKKVEKQLNVDNVKEANKVTIKSTNPVPRKQSTELVHDAVISANVDNQRSSEEKVNKSVTHASNSDKSETEDLLSKSTTETVDVKPIEKKASKLSLNSSCEFIEMDSVTKPTDLETKGEDDWEFDKWDDDIEEEIEDLVAKSKSTTVKEFIDATKQENQTKTSDKTEEEHAEKLSDEDGWQIDDWDDENTPNEGSEPIKDVKTSTQDGLSNVLDKLSSPKPPEPTNWGWTPWGGMVQLLSTATSHVSQVIESGIGVPNPEEIARLQHEENLKNRELGAAAVTDVRKDDKSMLLGNLMSGVSQIGNRVISGGLDTLEGIGKKTMTMLQENDPGLLNKRKMLGMMDKDTPVLSQILREAKEKTEEAEQNLKEMQQQRYKKQLHFESLFDDYHGLVHLEALEMLSQQSALKLKALMSQLTGLALSELEETLNEVKELCELPEMDNDDSDGQHTTEELSDKFNTSVEDLDIPVDFKDVIQ